MYSSITLVITSIINTCNGLQDVAKKFERIIGILYSYCNTFIFKNYFAL